MALVLLEQAGRLVAPQRAAERLQAGDRAEEAGGLREAACADIRGRTVIRHCNFL